jgi:hypothetical protein
MSFHVSPPFLLLFRRKDDGISFHSSRSRRKRSHTLRYVLRNRATNDTYLVILFSLYLREDINEDGSLKPAALEATREDKELAKESGKIRDEPTAKDEGTADSNGDGNGDDDVD